MPPKIVLCLLTTVLLTAVPPAHAQQPTKIPRIGFLQRRVAPTPANPDPLSDAFLQGLRELGYIDGKNIEIEHRYAEGQTDRLPGLIAEFVQLKVDVIVVASTPAIRAAKQATSTIPIVDRDSEAIRLLTGLVDSLARPGGNITGLTRLTSELSGKRLEMLKETVPGAIACRRSLWECGTLQGSNVQGLRGGRSGFQRYTTVIRPASPKPDVEGTFQAAVKAGVQRAHHQSGCGHRKSI